MLSERGQIANILLLKEWNVWKTYVILIKEQPLFLYLKCTDSNTVSLNSDSILRLNEFHDWTYRENGKKETILYSWHHAVFKVFLEI